MIVPNQIQQYQHLLKFHTHGKSLHNITSEITNFVNQSGIKMGLCTIFLRHTSASLIIQENADPDVLKDLETFFAKLIPENNLDYRHNAEGSDDMPAHIRTVITKTSEHVPISNGRLCLGMWQGIYLWEHRTKGSMREIVIHISGS